MQEECNLKCHCPILKNQTIIWHKKSSDNKTLNVKLHQKSLIQGDKSIQNQMFN